MRYIKDITKPEKTTLEEGNKNSTKFHFRRRCDAILLSNRGKSVPYICDHFDVPSKTVYRWFTRWQSGGISGLLLQKGRGLKAILDSIVDESLAQELRSSIALNPQKLAEVAADLSEKTDSNTFSFHRWASQALGIVGKLLGWSRFLEQKVQKQASDSLQKFIQQTKTN